MIVEETKKKRNLGLSLSLSLNQKGFDKLNLTTSASFVTKSIFSRRIVLKKGAKRLIMFNLQLPQMRGIRVWVHW
jgi:hypothetical protein